MLALLFDNKMYSFANLRLDLIEITKNKGAFIDFLLIGSSMIQHGPSVLLIFTSDSNSTAKNETPEKKHETSFNHGIDAMRTMYVVTS